MAIPGMPQMNPAMLAMMALKDPQMVAHLAAMRGKMPPPVPQAPAAQQTASPAAPMAPPAAPMASAMMPMEPGSPGGTGMPGTPGGVVPGAPVASPGGFDTNALLQMMPGVAGAIRPPQAPDMGGRGPAAPLPYVPGMMTPQMLQFMQMLQQQQNAVPSLGAAIGG